MRTQHLNLRRLFASDLSVRILASALEQQCETRMSFCRDILILLHIISRLSARVSIWPGVEKIGNVKQLQEIPLNEDLLLKI